MTSDHLPLLLSLPMPSGVVTSEGEVIRKQRPHRPRKWKWPTQGLFNQEVEKLDLLGLETNEALTDVVEEFENQLAAAAKRARRKDTGKETYEIAEEPMEVWRQSEERQELQRRIKALVNAGRKGKGPADWQPKAREIERQLKKLKDKTLAKAEKANQKFLDQLHRKDPRGLFRLVKKAHASRGVIPVPFAEQIKFMETVAKTDFVTTVEPDPTLVIPSIKKASISGPEELLFPITVKEIERALKKMESGKAADAKGLNAEMFKHGPAVMKQVLAIIFNRALDGEDVTVGAQVWCFPGRTSVDSGPGGDGAVLVTRSPGAALLRPGISHRSPTKRTLRTVPKSSGTGVPKEHSELFLDKFHM